MFNGWFHTSVTVMTDEVYLYQALVDAQLPAIFCQNLDHDSLDLFTISY